MHKTVFIIGSQDHLKQDCSSIIASADWFIDIFLLFHFQIILRFIDHTVKEEDIM
jgi:hypothetical protein